MFKPGPRPAPRRTWNPRFREAVVRSGCPSWVFSKIGNFPHPVSFSTLFNKPQVPATPLVVDRFARIAEEVGFPADQIFIDSHGVRS